jgi:hypothetical protein
VGPAAGAPEPGQYHSRRRFATAHVEHGRLRERGAIGAMVEEAR